MNHWLQTAISIGLATIIGVSYPCVSLSQTPTPTPAVHDGQRDFDFNIGAWHNHIKRIDPFASSSDRSFIANLTRLKQ